MHVNFMQHGILWRKIPRGHAAWNLWNLRCRKIKRLRICSVLR
ncbi:hypothetical protein CAMGR0001_1559 [Campylobacter gracilis RM3268]|uniref:Uncharacterized protein n=1 Tax=Campylobacter gracilis RM3268 TaxID=553220 RepID=C8PK09_9BACT|nr:hypothetical protein CAMGR0001_1559 [Campylobacter gracilis RM3268]